MFHQFFHYITCAGDAVEELVEHDTEVLGSNPGRVMQFACLVGRAEGS